MTALRNPKADPAFRPVRHELVTFPSRQASGLSLRKALRRLCADRLSDGVDLGLTRDWVRAAAYLSALLDHEVNVQTVEARLIDIGYPAQKVRRSDVLHTGWEVGAATEAGFLTKSARIFGDLVQITREERERLDIRCMDAIDEQAADRRRRLKAASAKRARLKAGATAREESDASAAPWVGAGVSRRTWYRRKAMAPTRGAVILSKNIATHETVPSDTDVHETVPLSEVKNAA
jgi:hypothetical protein